MHAYDPTCACIDCVAADADLVDAIWEEEKGVSIRDHAEETLITLSAVISALQELANREYHEAQIASEAAEELRLGQQLSRRDRKLLNSLDRDHEEHLSRFHVLNFATASLRKRFNTETSHG